MTSEELLEYLKRLSQSLNETSEIVQSMCLNILDQSSSQDKGYDVRLSYEGRTRAAGKKSLS